jgi:hypothetical protein
VNGRGRVRGREGGRGRWKRVRRVRSGGRGGEREKKRGSVIFKLSPFAHLQHYIMMSKDAETENKI